MLSILKKVFPLTVLIVVIALPLFANAKYENIWKGKTNGKLYFTELETLKWEQKQALEKLKLKVSPHLPREFQDDIYLIKFLKYNHFDVMKAEKHIIKMLKWRQDNNIDELVRNPPACLEEIQTLYPIYVDGYDKEERPICEIPLGAWNLGEAVAAGNFSKLLMHLQVNCFERAAIIVREQQAQGKNISAYVVLQTLTDLSVSKQICPTCIPLVLSFAEMMEVNYPSMSHGYWLINVPYVFSKMYAWFSPMLSSDTLAHFAILSSDETEWKPWLEERVDLSQISDWFGGGKKRPPLPTNDNDYWW